MRVFHAADERTLKTEDSLVERIVAGRQPPELTAQALRTGRFDIPVGWAAQKRALGFAQPA